MDCSACVKVLYLVICLTNCYVCLFTSTLKCVYSAGFAVAGCLPERYSVYFLHRYHSNSTTLKV